MSLSKRIYQGLTGLLLILAGSPLFVFAQDQSIIGKVINKNNDDPVQLAEVYLLKNEAYPKNSTIISSTVSDEDGNFSLSGKTGPEAVLAVFCLGYEPQYVSLTEVDSNYIQIELTSTSYPLEGITIRSLKFDIPFIQSPIPVSIFSKESIIRLPSQTLPSILEQDPAITLARDGMWPASINIRGFNENRVVLMVDGARVETATDVAGAFSMINPLNINKIEIIKGASSSIYGSKAMGGVVHVLTDKPAYRKRFGISGSVSGEYHSANNLAGENLSIAAGNENWFLGLSGFNRNAGDVKTPESEIVNSGFNDQGLKVNFGFKPFQDHEVNLDYQLFHGWDIGIPGGRVFPANATVTYKNVHREMISFDYRINDIKGFIKTAELKYYRQSILREVEIDPNAPPSNAPRQLETINPTGKHVTNGLILQSQAPMGRLSLFSGLDLWERRLNSERNKIFTLNRYDSTTQSTVSSDFLVVEKPLPDARAGNLGFFIHADYDLIPDKLSLLINTRADHIINQNEASINPLYTITDGETDPLPDNQQVIYQSGRNEFTTWGVNIGLNYRIGNGIHTYLNSGRSFRAPSIEELYKYIDLGSRIEYGNPELRQENGYFFDLGLMADKNNIRIAGNMYYNTLDDLISLQLIEDVPFDYHYEYFNTRDDIRVFQNKNIDQASIYGFETSVQYIPHHAVQLYGNLGYVTGKDRSTGSWLPMMPPLHGRIGLKKRWLDLLWTDLGATIYNRQDRIAAGETATDGFTRLDFNFSTKEFKNGGLRWTIWGGVENIFNSLYTYHLSANRGGIMYEPGRNIFLRAEVKW